jgi:hypothetical protein
MLWLQLGAHRRTLTPTAVAPLYLPAHSPLSCATGLFSATQPAISGCSGIRIGCWTGAYAQLSRHFVAANLDPGANQWNKAGAAVLDLLRRRCMHPSWVVS